jgi:hypothetical protein
MKRSESKPCASTLTATPAGAESTAGVGQVTRWPDAGGRPLLSNPIVGPSSQVYLFLTMATGKVSDACWPVPSTIIVTVTRAVFVGFSGVNVKLSLWSV